MSYLHNISKSFTLEKGNLFEESFAMSEFSIPTHTSDYTPMGLNHKFTHLFDGFQLPVDLMTRISNVSILISLPNFRLQKRLYLESSCDENDIDGSKPGSVAISLDHNITDAGCRYVNTFTFPLKYTIINRIRYESIRNRPLMLIWLVKNHMYERASELSKKYMR